MKYKHVIILAWGLLLLPHDVPAEVGSADLNDDSRVDVADFLLFVQQFGLKSGDDGFVPDLKVENLLPAFEAVQKEIDGIKKEMDEIKKSRPIFNYVRCKYDLSDPTSHFFRVRREDLVKRLNIPDDEIENYRFDVLYLVLDVHRGIGSSWFCYASDKTGLLRIVDKL